MITENSDARYSPAEEWANGLIHGLGIVLSIAGLAVLVGFASVYGDVWHIVACSIYGASQILLYTTSTLYHSIPLPRVKRVLRLLDHSAIFLLIAGTYTPFLLVNLRGPLGWALFGLVWSIAIIGIAMQGYLLKQKRIVNVVLYVAMGCLIVVAIKPLIASVGQGGLTLILAGGLSYVIGSVFYVWKRLPFNHAIWHGFVLVGSVFHFFAVLYYVIPLAH